ncbi:hypothetical protein [Ruania alba]|uniref:Uncharacterized protein n=1 Tax=Ruania alba TaxID=648782 RepID=A0A1H5G216_9MICO|nr:hypothetical protein [Ruania alba]SEE09434.1 hypothetical protein SAMN04488554_1509 [Ruania alba]
MTVDERVLTPMPVARDRTTKRGAVVVASLRGMTPAVVGGAAIIATDSIFSPGTAVHQWVLVGYSVLLWVFVPAIAAAAVVAGVSAHRTVTVTPPHAALVFGAAAALWMTLGVSNIEGSVYGIVLGAGAVVASALLVRGEDKSRATGHAAVAIAVTAIMLSVAVPPISSVVQGAFAELGLPVV